MLRIGVSGPHHCLRQLQEQLRVTKQYQQDVTRVQEQVNLLQAQTSATIARINAEAEREATVIINQANADALEREQAVKGEMYSKLREHLGWSPAQFLQYVRIKALNAQPGSKVMVGVGSVGNMGA